MEIGAKATAIIVYGFLKFFALALFILDLFVTFPINEKVYRLSGHLFDSKNSATRSISQATGTQVLL